MNKVYKKLNNCLKSVRNKTDFVPEIALVLGSGLGEYAEEIEVAATIDYKEIEGFPVSTVPGHKGRFIFGYVNQVPVVIMQGRVHYYEGYDMTDVVLPARLMGLMGAKILFLTNASGGINKTFNPGDFMLLKDQIATFVPSPLMGENLNELGARFPDMSDIYQKELQQTIKEAAKEEGIELQEGVYLQLSGPAYESPAEVRMCGILGADAVGMSTACEAVAANHMGMKVCGISCITNMACGIIDQPLSHTEVQETADRVAPKFKKLITTSITKLSGK
jgi:purine-nucleoside phosphorylase